MTNLRTLLKLLPFRLWLAVIAIGVGVYGAVPAPEAHAQAKPKKGKAKKGKAKKGKAEKGKAEAKVEAKAEEKDEPKPKKKKKKKGEKAEEAVPAAAEEAPAAPKEEDPLAREGAATFKVETALDQKQIDKSAQADVKRDEAIEELKKLIPKAPSTRKAEMIFRLAELYWAKSKYNYAKEMEAFEKAYTAWVDSGRKSKEPDPKGFTRQSELIKQNALALYEKVLGEYPTYERNDEVLFYLGYNEYEAGNKAKAVSNYWTLIKQFPKSRLVPDAYLQLGEHFFNENKVIKARKALERALAANAPKVYNYALYKLAWCDYNLQEYASGITKLKEVIDRSEKAGQEGVQLKSEALGDLARFFSFTDEVDTAFAYFKKKGGEDIALRYTTKLGELFHDQGKWDLEIQTYQMLNNKYPMHAKAPELQSRVVAAYSQLNKKDMVRQEVERLVDLYRPGTPWYKAQERKGDKAALEYAFDLTESNLRDLVTEYHRDAQKRKDVPTYELARDIYRKYLDAFDATESAYQMRFFYAEVLWALKEWRNAADQYDRVARLNEGSKPGRFARTAAYNAILAWEKIVTEGEKGDLSKDVKIVEQKSKGTVDRQTTRLKIEKLNQEKSYEPQKIPEVEVKLSAACDLYFDIADPKDEDLPAIKFKAAFIYYKHFHFVEAAKRYFEMIERWPGSDLSRKSADLILDSLNVQEQWDELEQYARAFKKNKTLIGTDKEFTSRVQGLIEGAAFKSIMKADEKAKGVAENSEQRAGRAAAAKRFRAFRDEFPESQYAGLAVFNALVIYDKADELDHAIEAAELLLQAKAKEEKKDKKDKKKEPAETKKDGTDIQERAQFLLAGFYERIANFKKSADLYSEYYEEYSDAKSAGDALFNAGVYYQGIGDSKAAIAHYQKYVDAFPDRDDVPAIFWRICEIYDADKDWKQSLECWGKFKDKFKKASKAKVFASRYKVALAMEQLKQRPAALKEYKWLVTEYPKLDKKDQEADEARLAGAHAAFTLLEDEFRAYKSLKITLQKKTLEAKAKGAEELACIDGEVKCKVPGKYLTVLGFGNGDYGIAALTRMGEVFRDMANSIRNAPLPRNLDEDQLEIYRAELDNVALGPEEKALEAFENALGKAYELNIYNEWTLLAQDNLKELNPQKFPDPQNVGYRGAEGFYVADIDSAAPAKATKPAEKGADEKPAEKPADDESAQDAAGSDGGEG